MSRTLSAVYWFNCDNTSILSAGPVTQSVASPIADPGVMRSIPNQPNTFVQIEHEILSNSHSPPPDSRRAVVSYKRKHVHWALVNRFV